jgi:hypothetical protein
MFCIKKIEGHGFRGRGHGLYRYLNLATVWCNFKLAGESSSFLPFTEFLSFRALYFYLQNEKI